MFYDINGNRIHLIECENCHHQVGLPTGNPDDYSSLKEMEKKEKCCNKPLFQWLCSGSGIIHNFSNP